MSEKGLIRANTLEAVVSIIKQHGGSVRRVFDRSNLPITLLEQGDLPIPITDVFNFMREAGWEIGDPMIGAFEGANASLDDLGHWGDVLRSSDTLAGAIFIDCTELSQYATRSESRLRVIGNKAHYSFEFLDPGKEGRLQSELSAIGYNLDLLRQYIGSDVPSIVVHVPHLERSEISRLEQIYGVPCFRTEGAPKVVFDACMLATTAKPQRTKARDLNTTAGSFVGIQLPETITGAIEAIASMLLLDGNPKVEDVAKRMGMSTRSAQRVLKTENTSFSAILATLKAKRAVELMDRGRSLSNVASSLGYSDPAHFSRAFSRWAGMPPGQFMTYTRELQAR